MAWEWSHTIEAYENARENFEQIFESDVVEACTIICEWWAHDCEQSGYEPWGAAYDKRYQSYLRRATEPGWLECQCERIWNRIEELATCDNGGFNAWACPDGCHTVSFSRSNDSAA